MDGTLVEFECRIMAELYPKNDEKTESVLSRGMFQGGRPSVIRWRQYDLDDDGIACDFGEWVECDPLVIIMGEF